MPMSRRDFLIHATSAGVVLGLATRCSGGRPKTGWPENPFLQGNFAPAHEEITADNLTVIGKLPPELDGMYVRNGPNPQFPPIKSYHWFEGDGMLHGVRVQGGRASYRNRYIRTAGWQEERTAGKAVYRSFLDSPDFWRMLTGKPPYKNTANTAVVWHDGRLLALMEAAEPYEIKVPSLDTVGSYTYGGTLRHRFTAHPKVDLATGELLFFGYAHSAPYLLYSVVNAEGQIARTTPIDIPRSVMMHDFAVTARYSIFMDLPLTFSLWRKLRGGPMLKFEPELGARFGILPRHGTGQDIRWFEASACWVFHTLNAYEDNDEIVLLACRFDQFPEGVAFQRRLPKHPTDGKETDTTDAAFLYRWRFNLKTGRCTEGPLDDTRTEFPRINDALIGQRSRFGYCGRAGGSMFDGLIKYDLDKGTSEHHLHGRHRMGGEGVFVPRPDPAGEDDGWLVTYVHDNASGKSEMVVETRDFRSPPVARVILPARVPYGFHGTWISSTQLAQQR